MCFSASASFIASAALAGIGTAVIIKKRQTPDWPLAAIPFIFAIQQFIEGLLWLSLTKWESAGATTLSAFFLFFAFFWWPAYIPWTAAKLESNLKRKKILIKIWLTGLIFGATLYGFFLLRPVSAYIQQDSICYGYYPYFTGSSSFLILVFIYFGLTLIPGLLTKHRVFRIFALFSTFFATSSLILYKISFVSTWCFFAAILSLILLIPPKKLPKRH